MILGFNIPSLSNAKWPSLFHGNSHHRLYFLVILNLSLLVFSGKAIFNIYDDFFDKENSYEDLTKKIAEAKIARQAQEDLLNNTFLQEQYDKLTMHYQHAHLEEWLHDFCKNHECSAILSLSHNTHQSSSLGESVLSIPLSLTIRSKTDRAVFLLMHELMQECPYLVEVNQYHITRNLHPTAPIALQGKKSIKQSLSHPISTPESLDSDDPPTYPFEAKIDATILSLVE